MKRFVFLFLFIMSTSAAAQPMRSVLLRHVDEARLALHDETGRLSAEQRAALHEQLAGRLRAADPGVEPPGHPRPTLRLVIDAYETRQGWHHITLRAELWEAVTRDRDTVAINALTWSTRSESVVRAASHSLLDGIAIGLGRMLGAILPEAPSPTDQE